MFGLKVLPHSPRCLVFCNGMRSGSSEPGEEDDVWNGPLRFLTAFWSLRGLEAELAEVEAAAALFTLLAVVSNVEGGKGGCRLV